MKKKLTQAEKRIYTCSEKVIEILADTAKGNGATALMVLSTCLVHLLWSLEKVGVLEKAEDIIDQMCADIKTQIASNRGFKSFGELH